MKLDYKVKKDIGNKVDRAQNGMSRQAVVNGALSDKLPKQAPQGQMAQAPQQGFSNTAR